MMQKEKKIYIFAEKITNRFSKALLSILIEIKKDDSKHV